MSATHSAGFSNGHELITATSKVLDLPAAIAHMSRRISKLSEQSIIDIPKNLTGSYTEKARSLLLSYVLVRSHGS
jgi:hypothetical protein